MKFGIYQQFNDIGILFDENFYDKIKETLYMEVNLRLTINHCRTKTLISGCEKLFVSALNFNKEISVEIEVTFIFL